MYVYIYWQERAELELMLGDDSSLAEEVREEILQCDEELRKLEVGICILGPECHPICWCV